MSGEALTILAVRVATVLYTAALWLRLTSAGEPGRRLARLAWSAAFASYLAHVYGAFQFVHGWSHARALGATARETEALVGVAWGGGLYVNYAFTVVWLADVLWWWVAPVSYAARSRWISRVIGTFLAFVFLNATVVFGAGLVRWFGLLATAALIATWWRTKRRGAR